MESFVVMPGLCIFVLIRGELVLGWCGSWVCGVVLVFLGFWLMVFGIFALGAALFGMTMVISVFRRIVGMLLLRLCFTNFSSFSWGLLVVIVFVMLWRRRAC